MVAFGGGWQWVPRALEALRRNTSEPYEVILVDNGGALDRPVPDGTNVELVLNDKNVGFGLGSNQGVGQARGDVVCLLNTDALVEPGWLPPVLERVHDGDVGAVLPAKLNLDGTMQQAGAFVTGEANAFIFGDGDDADSPEHGFPRDIDFGSAAAMCMTRSRFLEFGGFDQAYQIAYYEDADLCFRLREQGLRLVYEPRSRVLHARSVSAPSGELVDAYTANREVFLSRWKTAIECRPLWEQLRSDPRIRLEARDLHARGRLLLVGAPERLAHDLASAHPRARVTFLVEEIDPSSERALLESGVEVVRTRDVQEWLSDRAGHYTHVVTDEEPSSRLRAMLRETQPQARFLDRDEAIAFDSG
jgi:GT2 family glycosyltransferase